MIFSYTWQLIINYSNTEVLKKGLNFDRKEHSFLSVAYVVQGRRVLFVNFTWIKPECFLENGRFWGKYARNIFHSVAA